MRQFAAYLGRSPDTASTEDLRNYQLNLVDHSISPVSLNAAISGLKFFFDITPDRQELMARMPLSTASRSRWSSSLRPNGDLCCYPGSGWSSTASAGLPAFAAYPTVTPNMPDNIENLVLEHLRTIRTNIIWT